MTTLLIVVGGYLLFAGAVLFCFHAAARLRAFNEADDVRDFEGGTEAYQYLRDTYSKGLAEAWWRSRSRQPSA